MFGRFLYSIFIILFGLSILVAAHTQAYGGQADTRLVLTLPDISWSLEIAMSGFTIKEKKINDRADGAMLMAENAQTRVSLSAFIEKAAKPGDSKACREHYWKLTKRSPLKMKEVRMYESGPMAIVEYLIPEVGTVKVNQKHINAYLAVGDYWIDVHLSQIFHKPGPEDPLTSILETIGINDSYVPTVKEHFAYASYYYLKEDYLRAARHYEQVLGRNEPQPTLDRKSWRIVVDQLGMSYGLSDESAKAKDLFEWAIKIDPEYPMFYYCLACASAEMDNPEEALRNLRLAYQYKANMLPGEPFPNPKTDPSFKKYLKDKRFRAELEKMK
ncbi:MAG: tetratricopeptide repeat protein [Acidobacteria bacterium]|nr:tetratricopeptide repeat protein [Acidobacteriota bacterium]